MSKIFSFIQSILPKRQQQQDRDDSYLAEAVDIYDLERRMRELDQRRRHSASYGGLPLQAWR